MPRITLPHPDTMTPEQRRVHDGIVNGPRGRIQGPLRAALHSPELAERWSALGAQLRYGTGLSRQQAELAILVTGRASRSPFEWYAHEQEALKAGIDPAVIEALLQQRLPEGLDETDTAIVQAAMELKRLHSITDATYARALSLLGERTLVELVALVGYYTMVAMTLNAHEIPLPEGVAPAFALPQHDEAQR
ncbi:MAG: carboxymuconolactone decarboxylase family protein [Aquincola tertiaricarbonis]